MKITLENDFKYSEMLPLRNTRIEVRIPLPFILISLESDLIYKVLLNETSYLFLNQKTIKVPVVFKQENICTIEIFYNNVNVKYFFEIVEPMQISSKIHIAFADFHRQLSSQIGVKKCAIEELTNVIETGHLSLFHLSDPITGFDDYGLLEELEEILPIALDICSRPKRHIKAENEIIHIEQIKRISSSSIQHLSSHSEHWKGRRINGLVPLRMLATVFEDEINIYENLFFKMVIDKVLIKVSQTAKDVETNNNSKRRMIEWQKYGNQLNDYKRAEILRRVFPSFNNVIEEKNLEYSNEFMEKLNKVERNLSTILSTDFYKSIDRNRKVHLPIIPTNIIRMDRRYKKIFDLWNKLIANDKINNHMMPSEGNADSDNISSDYFEYIQILTLYAFTLMGYEISENSYAMFNKSKKLQTDIVCSNDIFEIHCYSENDSMGLPCIQIKIEEKMSFILNYPAICQLDNKLSGIADYCSFNTDEKTVIFHRRPTINEEKDLKNFIRTQIGSNKSFAGKQGILAHMEREWKDFIGNALLKIPKPREYNIKIIPISMDVGIAEADFIKGTQTLLDSGKSIINDNETLVFMIPIDIEQEKYLFFKRENVINRIINYGEAFEGDDAKNWGGYKLGILPISQTEIMSIQRIMKLISLHLTRLTINWGHAAHDCPVCKSNDTKEIDSQTRQCLNDGCEIVWGECTCSNDQCNHRYPWIKKEVKVRRDNQNPERLSQMLSKEAIFDKWIITDFDSDFSYVDDIHLKYVPKCPKCGCSSIKRQYESIT